MIKDGRRECLYFRVSDALFSVSYINILILQFPYTCLPVNIFLTLSDVQTHPVCSKFNVCYHTKHNSTQAENNNETAVVSYEISI